MARRFDGTTGDYILLGINSIGPLLDGAGAVTVAARYNQDNAAEASEYLYYVASLTGWAVMALYVNSSNKAVIGGRARYNTTWREKASTGSPSAGSWNTLVGVLDYANDNIYIYLNGTRESSLSVTFGGTSYTHDTSTRDDDCLGIADSNGLTAPVDGNMAEVAIWAGDIGLPNMAAFNAGVCPLLIFPSTLICYWPLTGRTSPEIELISRKTGAVTGAAAVAHPPVIYPQGLIIPEMTAYSAPAGGVSYRRRLILAG